MSKRFLESFIGCIAFPQKWFCIFQANLEFLALHQYWINQRIRFSFWLITNKFIGNSNIKRKFWGHSKSKFVDKKRKGSLKSEQKWTGVVGVITCVNVPFFKENAEIFKMTFYSYSTYSLANVYFVISS